MIRYYKVVPSDEAATEMERQECETTGPRYSLDGSEAILRYSTDVDGSITHEQALSLMSTEAWALPPIEMEIPQ